MAHGGGCAECGAVNVLRPGDVWRCADCGLGVDGSRVEGGCGCCGRVNETDGPLWCTECAGHVGDAGPFWERTFEALHGRPCPHQACIHAVIDRALHAEPRHGAAPVDEAQAAQAEER